MGAWGPGVAQPLIASASNRSTAALAASRRTWTSRRRLTSPSSGEGDAAQRERRALSAVCSARRSVLHLLCSPRSDYQKNKDEVLKVLVDKVTQVSIHVPDAWGEYRKADSHQRWCVPNAWFPA
jgi:hypothetical protein